MDSSTLGRAGVCISGAAISKALCARRRWTQNEQHRTANPQTWTWLVVGAVFAAVAAMLYGPFISELTHGWPIR